MNNFEQIVLRIAPDKFHFLKFILEGYDNMAILSSLHGKRGLVIIRYPLGLAQDLFSLLTAICKELS